MMRLVGTVVCCLTFLAAIAARADDAVDFPLQGYYHPGRYMPVHVSVTPKSAKEAEGQVCLTSSGSLWTFVRYEGGPINTIVPWLPIDGRAQQLRWRRGFGDEYPVELPLKPLDERQRLVGYAGVSAADASAVTASIYEGDPVIPIELNANQPLPCNPAAWETLDAVVLSADVAARLTEPQFAGLVACGTAFAVRGDAEPPFRAWPWKRAAPWWTIRHVPAGPRSVTYDEALFSPVASWNAGWATTTLKRLVMACAIFGLLVLAAALWRPRRVAVVFVLLAAVFTGLLAFWGTWHVPTITVGSKVRVVDHGITQDDDWAYQTSHVRAASLVRWLDVTKPMFASIRQLDLSGARVVCYPNGDPDFIFVTINPNVKVALLARHAGPQAHSVQPDRPITSPMLSLVKERYLMQGDRIAGELPAGPVLGESYFHRDLWPAIVIERDAAR